MASNEFWKKTMALFPGSIRINATGKNVTDAEEPSELETKKPIEEKKQIVLQQKPPEIQDNSKILDDQKAAIIISQINSIASRLEKFKSMLTQPVLEMSALKKLCWNGIPNIYRAQAWQILIGYLPLNFDRRQSTLDRKRNEYFEIANQYFSKGEEGLEYTTYHQIHIDMPRTHPEIPLYQIDAVQRSLERILYCWAIRHPASGYVQGINDLATPFFQVFLASYYDEDHSVETMSADQIDPQELKLVEADTFWCLTKLLDGIQDNYTFSQPGIQRQVQKLNDLVMRIDGMLCLSSAIVYASSRTGSYVYSICVSMGQLPVNTRDKLDSGY